MESLLVREMNQLSFEERNRALEDVHAVSKPVTKESEEFLNAKLEELQHHLDDILRNDMFGTASYREARRRDPSYVANASFQLSFLRADYFDPRAAAERMMRHFQCKQSLFGAEKLGRDITIDDLDEEDIRLMSLKVLDILPNLDQAGRLVAIMHPTLLVGFAPENLLRNVWYYGMRVAMRDDITGLVSISYNTGPNRMTDNSSLRAGMLMSHALPGRQAVAYHLCVDVPELEQSFPAVRYHLSKPLRLRSRCHFGHYNDHQRSLRSYGIPVAAFTITGTEERGLIRNTEFQNIQSIVNEISQRKQQLMMSSRSSSSVASEKLRESETTPTSGFAVVIDSPGPMDVVFGKGKARNHVGNQRLVKIVCDYSLNYHAANKSGKSEIFKCVVQAVHAKGGRFLRRVSEVTEGKHLGWIEVEQSMARNKVSKLLQRSKKGTVE